MPNSYTKPVSAAEMPAKNSLLAYLAGSQTIGSGATATVTYQTPVTNNCFTYSAGVWTCTVAGWYYIEAVALISLNSSLGQTYIRKNGVVQSSGCYIRLDGSIPVSGMVYLGIGDTFDIRVFVTTSGTLYNTSPDYSYLRALRML